MPAGIQIQGLAEFRRDLRRAGEGTKDATAVMKKAGQVVLAKAVGYAPKGDSGRGDKHPGALAGSGKILAAGSKGRVVFRQAYAAGAEFGSHGRWQGFDRWGQPPRYGYRALNETTDQIAQIVADGMAEVVSVYGWFHA
jgi:hypothetical protein